MNSVSCILDRAADLWGHRPALEDESGRLAYRELRDLSRRIAGALLRAGLRRCDPVAVFLPKGIPCVVSFWGALYCGSPYAPLDSGMPDARLSYTLENLSPGCVITDSAGVERITRLIPGCRCLNYEDLIRQLPDEDSVRTAEAAVTDADPAYIMYTSGSTGRPKGVVIPHRGVLDYANWLVELFSLSEETVFGLQSGFHFDNSVFDLYAGALCGGLVQIVPEILYMYPLKLMEYIRDKAVTCVFWVPTVMISVANTGALNTVDLPDLKTVVFAGEVMPNKQLNIWRKALPGRTFANLYGPTEITVDCTCYLVDRPFRDEDPLPIGYVRPNMRVLVLREDGTEAAPGEIGELCVLGSQLALGYWNAPEETSRAFTVNPLCTGWAERMYRTGDLVSRSPDGLLFFIGRRDSQIKLRGNRIELGEIETAARELPEVRNTCALFDSDAERIVLFLETDRTFQRREIHRDLGKKLPKYMLPGKVICLDVFPLNANRKVDRIQLRTLF